MQTPHDEKLEMQHLAQALEGLAGALHAGHPVPRADLEHAAAAAKGLWDAAGHEPDSEFPTYRRVLMEHAAGAARGEEGDASLVQRAARRLARELRQRAQGLLGPRPSVEPSLGAAVHRLDSCYARFGGAPRVAAP